MNKLINKSTRNWFIALVVAGAMSFAATYAPMLNAVAKACEATGGGC